MNYLGDFPTSALVSFLWNTSGADGGSITRSTDGTLRLYKRVVGGTWATERTSLAGVTQTEDFDTLTGVHAVEIDTSNNTDVGFYVAGGEYSVVMAGMVIDTKSVNAVIASFSLERLGGVLALAKGTSGFAAIKTETASLQTDTNDIQTRLPAALVAGRMSSDAVAISGSTTAADNVEANIANLDATVSSRATPAQVNTEADTALADYGALKPTVAARTLDVSTTGEAGIDWANIGSPTTPQNLTQTNIDPDQVIASVSGSVGSVSGAVSSVTNKVTPIDADGITYASAMEFLLAVLGGKAAPSGATVVFKKRDGTTSKATITYGASDGERTDSVINA